MYEMLTREHPYVSSENSVSPVEIIKAITKGSYRALRTPSEKTATLEKIIIRAVSKDSEQRYATADEMLKELLALPWSASQRSLSELIIQYGIESKISLL